MKTRHLLLGAALVAVAFAQPLTAATATAPLTVNAAVAARASLTVSSATITFPDADPVATPSIAATEGPLSITARGRTTAAGNITLTLLAAGDLASGADTIAISNVTWTASGTGYVAGTMNRTTAQSVGSWTGSGSYAGTMTFALANSWTYRTGNYTASATYTLTAP
jgi:hypothetical protein